MADDTFIYSVFANDFSASLQSLKDEKRGLRGYLRDKAGIEHVVFEDAVSSLLIDELTSYSGKIHIFHFAGHANGQTLKLEKADGEKEDFDVALLKGYLKKSFCEEIKLAFLNACDTHKLGQELISEGVPAAIITYGKVPDALAKKVSLKFFEILSKDKNKELSLKKMLDALEIYISAELNEEAYKGNFRSADGSFFEFEEKVKNRSEEEYLWGILYNEDKLDELQNFFPLSAKNIPDSLLNLPDVPRENSEEPEDENLKIIKQGVRKFNYSRQKRAIINHLNGNPFGTFFLHGGGFSGVNWFAHNQLNQLRHLKKAPAKNNIEFGDNLYDLEGLKEDLMTVLGLDSSGEDAIQVLSDGIFDILKSHPIILRIYDYDHIAKDLMEEIEQEILRPLTASLKSKIEAFNKDKSKPLDFHKCVILFVDDANWEIEKSTSEQTIFLPAIDEMDEEEFDKWQEYCLDEHGDQPWDQISCQRDQLLTHKKPYRFLQEAVGLLGYRFKGRKREVYHLEKK